MRGHVLAGAEQHFERRHARYRPAHTTGPGVSGEAIGDLACRKAPPSSTNKQKPVRQRPEGCSLPKSSSGSIEVREERDVAVMPDERIPALIPTGRR
jgi:hypothetical protein